MPLIAATLRVDTLPVQANFKKKLVPYDGVSYEEELEVGRRNRADA